MQQKELVTIVVKYWRKVQFTTGMGQHHQEESEGRQAGGGGGGCGGPRHHRLEQRPRQHHRDVLTDEADSRRRKLLWVDFLLSWVLGVQRTELFQNQDRWVYIVICQSFYWIQVIRQDLN